MRVSPVLPTKKEVCAALNAAKYRTAGCFVCLIGNKEELSLPIQGRVESGWEPTPIEQECQSSRCRLQHLPNVCLMYPSGAGGCVWVLQHHLAGSIYVGFRYASISLWFIWNFVNFLLCVATAFTIGVIFVNNMCLKLRWSLPGITGAAGGQSILEMLGSGGCLCISTSHSLAGVDLWTKTS